MVKMGPVTGCVVVWIVPGDQKEPICSGDAGVPEGSTEGSGSAPGSECGCPDTSLWGEIGAGQRGCTESQS